MRRVAVLLSIALMALAQTLSAAPRARALGIPFAGSTGTLNAITDVRGVEVGQVRLVSGRGKHAVRTGVTAILPRGKRDSFPVPASWFSLNGNGEMTGTTWLEESGRLEGPVILTNTHAVGTARNAVIAWGMKHFPGDEAFLLPVVAETWDGYLNDLQSFPIERANVLDALDRATGGAVAEGNTGGGTGMIAFGLKGGTGTASRRTAAGTVGALVQANFGAREDLVVAGVPVGPLLSTPKPSGKWRDGSIIVVVATDIPLLPHQLRRVAKRVSLGVGRTGGVGRHSSGDIFLAFSTARPRRAGGLAHWPALPDELIDPMLVATVQATEEAIINALVAAESMTGLENRTVWRLPHDELQRILRRYRRLN